MPNKRREDKKMFGAYLDVRQRKALKALAELSGVPQTSIVKILIMDEARRKGVIR